MTAATTPPRAVTIDRIRQAAVRLRGVTLVTPLVPFTDPSGHPLLLKAESLQPIGAFKLRGAYNAMASLDEPARRRGVATASSGNHGQGIARAARMLGVKATVVMPSGAPMVKQDRIRADGAEIVHWDPTATLGLQETADQLVIERGLTMIHPYDDDDVIAGQGTAGLEITEAIDELGAVMVPIGGGGLASGIATAVRAIRPHARIVGVEPELAADAQESFRAGRLIEWPSALGLRTIADGTRTNLSERTFGYISALFDDIVTVSDEEVAAAIRLMAERSRLVSEPSGALTLAAAVFRRREAGLDDVRGPIVAVVSGGNVDPTRFVEYLAAPIPT